MLHYRRLASELVRQRTSQRTYLPIPLEDHQRQALNEAIEKIGTGPFGGAARVRLVEGAALGPDDLRRFGSYGFISGATAFLSGTIDRGRDLVDFGFVFEQLILAATELGLGTCWVGGTLHRGAIAELIGAGPDDVVPAMSPVGATPPRRGLRDRLVRWSAGSADRKPASELFLDRSGRPFVSDGGIAAALEAVRLAPSASNRQPWRVVEDGGALHFWLRRSPGYRKLAAVDLQRIDMGIALCHFALVAREVGLPGALAVSAPAGPLLAGAEYVVTWIRP